MYTYSLIWKINVLFISLLISQLKMHNHNSKKHYSTIVHIFYCIYHNIEHIYFKCYFNSCTCNTLSLTMIRYSEDVWGANKMTQTLGSNSRITSDLLATWTWIICLMIIIVYNKLSPFDLNSPLSY